MFKKIIEKLYLRMKDNLVFYDSLTGVKTRSYYDMVAKEKYNKKECIIVFVDIDSLKETNDNNGHRVGDKLIKKVANKLAQLNNVEDICRIGGDEFVMICNSDFRVNDVDSIDSVSYGYYYKPSFREISDAVEKADKLMYRFKKERHERACI